MNHNIGYGENGQRYLKWVIDLATRVGINVQKNTCEDGAEGALINKSRCEF